MECLRSDGPCEPAAPPGHQSSVQLNWNLTLSGEDCVTTQAWRKVNLIAAPSTPGAALVWLGEADGDLNQAKIRRRLEKRVRIAVHETLVSAFRD